VASHTKEALLPLAADYLTHADLLSASLEFPVVFSLFTLIWCFAATSLLAGWTLYGRGRPGALSQVFLRVQPLAPIGVSVAAVVVRILLFSWSSQYSHCCLGGVYVSACRAPTPMRRALG
jgi:hypothetical protein